MTARIYEHPAWVETPQRLMRPGGLEVTEQALNHCSLSAGARVLDLGCGNGAVLGGLSAGRERMLFGVDISYALLRASQQNAPGCCFTQANGERLPLADACLDAVLAECTLSIMETDQVLDECARTLRPGGYLVINDIYARKESGIEALRTLPPGSCPRAALTREQMLEKLVNRGFQVIWWQDFSEGLRDFPISSLEASADVDSFDLTIAAAKAKLGYYGLAAVKR